MTWVAALWQPFLILGRHVRRLDLSRGSIDLTDARTLWEQQNAMRRELTERIVGLEQQITDLLSQISSLQKERTGLLVKIASLEARVLMTETNQ